jgi:hypothetical protein
LGVRVRIIGKKKPWMDFMLKVVIIVKGLYGDIGLKVGAEDKKPSKLCPIIVSKNCCISSVLF